MQVVRIATAAPLLVVILHPRDDVDQLRDAAHDRRSFRGMLLHHFELIVAERSRFAQNAVVDSDLSHVVQQRADAQIAHVLFGKGEILADGHRITRHAFGVAAGVRIFGVDRSGEHAHGVDEQQVILVRRLLQPLDRSLDRLGHRVEVVRQLADLVVRLQLDALLIISFRDLARALCEKTDRM